MRRWVSFVRAESKRANRRNNRIRFKFSGFGFSERIECDTSFQLGFEFLVKIEL